MRDLVGRVTVVTGGNRGIGLGLARGAARCGSRVAIWARRSAQNVAAVKELERLGVEAAAYECDVVQERDVRHCLDQTLDRFGRLDALIANAGTASPAPFADTTLDKWRSVLAVNLDGAFLSLRAGAQAMIEQGDGGALVAVSSVAALHGAPTQAAYASSKAALTALMRTLAVELAPYGIRCNSLLPGWTETEMTAPLRQHDAFMRVTTRRTPVRRWATPVDFERAGAYLADPTISFHTGDCLVVDGGYSVF